MGCWLGGGRQCQWQTSSQSLRGTPLSLFGCRVTVTAPKSIWILDLMYSKASRVDKRQFPLPLTTTLLLRQQAYPEVKSLDQECHASCLVYFGWVCFQSCRHMLLSQRFEWAVETDARSREWPQRWKNSNRLGKADQQAGYLWNISYLCDCVTSRLAPWILTPWPMIGYGKLEDV